MDREYPRSRAELEDKESWPYNDLQSLASELDYGNPVGESRADLVAHAVAELDLPHSAPDGDDREVGREIDREVDRQVDRESPTVEEQDETPSPQGTAGEPADDSLSTDDGEEGGSSDPIGDGGTATETTTDEVGVGHQGKEKLSPEGAPESEGTAVEPPGDLEADDIDRDVLEGDAAPSTSTDADDDVQDDDDSEEQSEGSLRERLGIGSKDESPEDVVDEADDPEERERREEMKQKFEEAMGGADQDDVDDAVQDAEADAGDGAGTTTAPTTTPAGGMMMDQEVVGSLIEMPFNFASGATGWDGWELSQRERQANARLFVAMCDEHDVDVTATTMFALSMASTFGGKAVRYRQLQDDDEDVVDGADEIVDDQDGEDFDDDVQDVAGRDGRRRRSPSSATSTENTENQSEDGAEETFGF